MEIVETPSSHPLTANAVVARVRLIQQVMKDVMKKDTHYGVIPGTQKNTLYKPGAEVLLVTFRIAPDEPKVEDLSTPDCVRYRVTRNGVAQGQLVASGMGECSSDEEKYRWRFAVCEAEWQNTPEDRRREKYKRDGTTIKQVRTNPADVANTILKMADKRAFVAMALLATAASDIFTQDLEDLPPEVAESIEGGSEKKEPIKPAQPKSAPSDGEAYEFVPSDFDTKSGEKNGKTWVKYGVQDAAGKWFSTFDEKLAEILSAACENKKAVRISYTTDGKFNTIKGATLAD